MTDISASCTLQNNKNEYPFMHGSFSYIFTKVHLLKSR